MTLLLEGAGLAALHLIVAVPLLVWGDRENRHYETEDTK